MMVFILSLNYGIVTGIFGLVNLGSTCFVNVVIQALVNLTGLRILGKFIFTFNWVLVIKM